MGKLGMLDCYVSNHIRFLVVSFIQLEVQTVLDHLQVSWGETVRYVVFLFDSIRLLEYFLSSELPLSCGELRVLTQ